MKMYDLFEHACTLIGVVPDENIKKAGLGLTNTILEDLGLSCLSSPTEEIEAAKGDLALISSGVAMLLCVYLGDDASLETMTEIYNSARKRKMSKTGRIKNTVFGGGEA